ASAPVASTAGGKAPPVVPRFQRAAAAEGSSAPSGPWAVTLSANLKKPAWNGNALFIFFDLDDPSALENRQFTAMYQAAVKAGPRLGVKVAVSPDEGFRAGHTYRLRIVQLINGKEILLCEGDLSLI